MEKVTMPGKKSAHRLYSNDGHALIDLLQRPDEDPPEVGKRVLCRHPFHVRTYNQCYQFVRGTVLPPSNSVWTFFIDVPLPFSQSYP